MSDRIPNLAALRAFAAVAHHGSFARAAEALHVSTSAVSHQISGLEDQLGAVLLTRARNGTGRTVVTEEGAELQRALDLAFAQLSAACDAVRTRRKRPRLVIAASGSVASLWLAPRLAAFAALHPSVEWLVRAVEDADPEMVREGIDLAILRMPRGALDRRDRKLFSETITPVASPSLHLQGEPEELLHHNLLQEDGQASELDWSTWLERLGVSPRARVTIVRFSTFNAAIGAAMGGAGIALGRQPLIDAELVSGRLQRLFADRALPGTRDFVIRARPGATRDIHVEHFTRYLLQSAEPDGSIT